MVLRARLIAGLLPLLFLSLAFSITLTQVTLTLLVLLWVPNLIDPDGRRQSVWPLAWPFAALVATTLLAALTSPNLGRSLLASKSLVLPILFFLLINIVHDAREADRLLRWFFVAMTCAALLGLAQMGICAFDLRPSGGWGVLSYWLERPCHRWSFPRASGPFSIYMTFGGVLMVGLLLLIPRLGHSGRETPWLIPGAIAIASALALTYTRNAWLGLGAGAAVLILFLRGFSRRLWVLLILVVFGALIALGPAQLTSRARSLFDPNDPTAVERLYLWGSGLGILRDHPITGIGPGMLSSVLPRYAHPESRYPRAGHLHNTPLQVAVERGLLGLGAWLWIWIAFVGQVLKLWRRLPSGAMRERWLVTGPLAAVAGFLVAGLFEYNFGDSEVVMLIYVAMAMPFIAERSLTQGGE